MNSSVFRAVLAIPKMQQVTKEMMNALQETQDKPKTVLTVQQIL
jgi:hypothetical protein